MLGIVGCIQVAATHPDLLDESRLGRCGLRRCPLQSGARMLRIIGGVEVATRRQAGDAQPAVGCCCVTATRNV